MPHPSHSHQNLAPKPETRQRPVTRRRLRSKWPSLAHRKKARWQAFRFRMKLSVVWRKEPVRTGLHACAAAARRPQGRPGTARRRSRPFANLRWTNLRLISNSSVHPMLGISPVIRLFQFDDGSVDLYFGPSAPQGFENNWVETIPDLRTDSVGDVCSPVRYGRPPNSCLQSRSAATN